ncbi:MAG TPA: ABC transporter substrate-binding protein [Chloroflexota bacterium]|nr:ABC transporter substrate-binding protein [Chloroflexota bacterium]
MYRLLALVSLGILAPLFTIALVACSGPPPAARSGAAPLAATPVSPGRADAPPAATAAASSPSTLATAPVKVRVGVLGLVGEAALYVALDKGYFRAQELDVELVHFNQTTDLLPALTTGQIDFAASGMYPNIFNAAERAIAVKIVSYLAVVTPRSTSAGIVVRQDHIDSGRYREPGDLKGMTVALGNPPGGTTHYYLERFATQAGITVDDVNMTLVPSPQMPVALANKAIDAAYAVEPFISVAEQQGSAKFVVPNGQFIAGMPVFVLQISPIFAHDQPAAAERFVFAVLQGQRFHYNAVMRGDGVEELYTILQNHTPVKDTTLLARMSTDAVPADGAMDPGPLLELQDAYVRYGTVRQRAPINEILDPSYAARAVQRLTR